MTMTGLAAALLLAALDIQPRPPQEETPVSNWSCANQLIDRHYRQTAENGRGARHLINGLTRHVVVQCSRPYQPSMGDRLQYDLRQGMFEQEILNTILHRLRRDGIQV